MNKEQLKQKLDEQNINPKIYSLNGELKLDRIILSKVTGGWEVFYFDEKGTKYDERSFSTETEACDYLYEFLNKYQKTSRKYGLNEF